MGLPGDRKSFKTGLAVYTQYRRVTDTQMDGRMDRRRTTANNAPCRASRG